MLGFQYVFVEAMEQAGDTHHLTDSYSAQNQYKSLKSEQGMKRIYKLYQTLHRRLFVIRMPEKLMNLKTR